MKYLLKIFVGTLLMLLGIVLFVSDAQAVTTISRPTNNLGLVVYYDFNFGKGTLIATDVSGNGNHGQLTGMDAATDWVDSKSGLGTALDFDGSNDYVVKSSPNISSSVNDFTLSFWFSRTNSSGELGGVVFRTAGNQHELSVNIENQDNGFDVRTNSNTRMNNRGSYTYGEWTFVTATRSGTDVILYVNGVQQGAAVVDSSGAVDLSSCFALAVELDSTCTSSVGSMESTGPFDDVRIYNRALSQEEISRLYKQTIPATIGTSVIDNGLVAHWDFNFGKGASVAYDISGNGNNGTMFGGDKNTDWVDSKSGLGTALDFDGSNDYVNSVDISAVNNISRMTVSLWLQQGTVVQNNDAAISKHSGGSNGWMITDAGGLSGQDDVVFFMRNGDTNSYGYTTSNVITTGKWHHVVMVFDGTQTGDANRLKGYIDGINYSLTFAGSIPATTHNLASTVKIGSLTTTTNFWNGKIDDVRIYTRALSADEVKRLYNLTQPQISRPSLDSGLVGYWDFNFGKGGSIAYDQMGAVNDNGTLTQMDKRTAWVDSKPGLGAALTFDRNNEGTSVDIEASEDVSTVGESFSISVWVKRNASGFANDYVLAKVNEYGIRTNANDTFEGFSWGCNIEGTTVYGNDEWILLTYTFDDTTNTGRFYSNGERDGGTCSGDTRSNTAILQIGDRNPEAAAEFGGEIDEVRIYNRVLSAEEIKRLYLLGQ